MQFDVKSRTIYKTVHGSRAYGLATETSDTDIKGVCIEPKAYHLGYLYKFEQEERLANKGHEADSVIYSLKKFVNLAADCNPNIIEVLHVDPKHILYIDKYGERLRERKDDFLSKKAMHTFSGYAYSQVRRIKTHREWLLNKPKAKPERADFGLRENPDLPTGQLQAAQAAITKKLQKWNFENMQDIDPDLRIMIRNTMAEMFSEANITSDSLYLASARSLGISDNFLEILDRERRYNNALDNWKQYNNWLNNRNPARAKLEAEFGYDLKHASHALRLCRMCCEILEGKGVIVNRVEDGEEILAIKTRGIWSFDKMLSEIERLSVRAQELYQVSKLPHSPNRTKLNEFVVSLTEDYLAEFG